VDWLDERKLLMVRWAAFLETGKAVIADPANQLVAA